MKETWGYELGKNIVSRFRDSR